MPKFVLPLVSLLCVLGAVLAVYLTYLNRTAINQLPTLAYETDAQLTAGHNPQICIGKFEGGDYGYVPGKCPPNSAAFANRDSTGPRDEASEVIPLDVVCCPLPASDILTDEHSYNITGSCPYNFVATGGSAFNCGTSCTFRCTRINTERYKLGEEHQAFYWKRAGTYPAAGRGEALQIKQHEIPAAIRYAAGRNGIDHWNKDGCVGAPFGALLVGKSNYGCDGYRYRPLLFKSGKAVRMFPECQEIEGVTTETPSCQK